MSKSARTQVGAAIAALAVTSALMAVSGCGRSGEQTAASDDLSSREVSDQRAPTRGGRPSLLDDQSDLVAGKPITAQPSGRRPDAPEAIPAVTNTDGGEIDRVTAMAIADIDEFWSGAYGPPLSGQFKSVADLFSWDSTDLSPDAKFCGREVAGKVNASMCFGERENCTPEGSCSSSYNTIGWDRGVLFPNQQRVFGDNAIGLIMAHETGHAIQFVSSDLQPRNVLVAEQQADCFAGTYIRWVTDGESPRFSLNTGEGLNKILAALIGFRDPLFTEEQRENYPEIVEGEHGSAFERVSAFEMGFNDGAATCAGIDESEVAQRRGNLPVALQSGESGENPVNEDSVAVLIEALNTLFAPADAPVLSFGEPSCPGVTLYPPASFCPSTNTVYADVPELAGLSTSISSEAGYKLDYLPQFGDYTAYSVLVSRYMLAVQQQEGLTLDGEQAGLRTACLTGVATEKMSEPVLVAGDQSIKLTAGDLDEAVAGVLVNGLLAADVNGVFAPKGFARVAAFRAGVLGDPGTCMTEFP